MAEIKPSVLIVDDELSIRESFSLILGKDFHVLLAASGEAALKKLIDEKIDLIYLDIRMPGMNGMATLKKIKEIDKDISIIMVTAVNDIQNASEAIKAGAKDYIVKPFDADKILKTTNSLTQKKLIHDKAKIIRAKSTESKSLELIGKSSQIKELDDIINKISGKDSPVLIFGENGTEKELIARIIHDQSNKSSGPFKIYNIPKKYSEEEIKKILFGSEMGSFVSAFKKQEGLFEKTSNGTLILNNIEFLNNNLMIELKNAISNKKYSRLGSMSFIPLDLRIIFISSTNIKILLNKKLLSQDLFNLINDSIIELPPLKARTDDNIVLIDHYIDKYTRAFGKKAKLSRETLDILTGYLWPGNMVELENTIKQLIINSKNGSDITPDNLPIDILINNSNDTSKYTSFDNIKGGFEKEYIARIIKKTNHNKVRTAKILGLSPKILESKLQTYLIKS